jgi:hypothetical protein
MKLRRFKAKASTGEFHRYQYAAAPKEKLIGNSWLEKVCS